MTAEPSDLRHAPGRGRSFAKAPGTEHLPAATIADLAELDAQIDAMVAQMQTPAAREALKQALSTRPKVRLDTKPPQG